MTAKPYPQFKPITVDDDALERLAQAKGVGTMVRPETGEGKGAKVAPAPAAEGADDRHKPTPRGRMKSVTLELPFYVWKELKIRAAHRETSVRHVIMHSLKLEGFEIREADMVEDGRRLRGSNAVD